jgi:hypothetical protein
VVLASAAAGYGGDRRRPVTGGAVRGSRRAVGLASEGRGESCRLAGGKGIPETITAHPCVFATLTAPSFGPVHSRRMRGKTVLPCRPRRDAHARRCPHGRDISCPTRHVEDDPRLGQPMCSDCYDYAAAVLFNAWAGKLWRRFTTYLPRHLARRLGITVKRLRALVRVRYVKVAEYQAARRRPLPRCHPPGRPRR